MHKNKDFLFQAKDRLCQITQFIQLEKSQQANINNLKNQQKPSRQSINEQKKLKMMDQINLELLAQVDSSLAYETNLQILQILHLNNIICILSSLKQQSIENTLVYQHFKFTLAKLRKIHQENPQVKQSTFQQVINLSKVYTKITRAQIYQVFGKILSNYQKKLKAILPFYYEFFNLAHRKQAIFALQQSVQYSQVAQLLKNIKTIKNNPDDNSWVA